ncbi:TlpA family protein disulfide reductase [Nesterenkonia xinjiangensis]|uniref:Thiol-disulfide isomerase/thioredoxin n=1 Tax=Nesterenkonia xinjiangensis TaxID=225327 RepID=A0A7Z0GK87_9MICC|nr:TlpA disulfide reductase family protein [Nesterenkonia xinjiangensis]NYJ77534.1 thiol-disulfide isomerase/thioredoxin [Nesterenkonia xinjiangensis]
MSSPEATAHEPAPRRPAMSRRALLGASGLMAGLLVMSACSSENDRLAEQAANDGSNYVAGDGSVQEFAPEERGEPVHFESTLFDGSAVDPARWTGEVVVINFWYAACAPCRVEAPDLAELHQEFADDGVQFYGVNTRDTQPTAEAFERRFGIEYPSMEDRDGRVMLAMTDYVPPSAVPTTLVLDRDGRVSARILGIAEPGTLRALITTALEESSQA